MKKKIKIILTLTGLHGILVPFMVAMLIISSFAALFMGGGSSSKNSGESGDVNNQNLSEEVLKLKPIMDKETALQGIPEHTPYLLGIMQVESSGRVPDPMQSSESAGLPAGTLATPEASIKQGVSYYKALLEKAEGKNCDIWTVIQAYNFGSSYIDYIANNGGVTTTVLADNYSKTVVAPSLGNTSGLSYPYNNLLAKPYNGGYLYLNGGNFFYDLLVRQYIVVGNNEGGSASGVAVTTIPPEYKDKLPYAPYNGMDYNTSGSYEKGQCTWYVYNRLAQIGKHVDEYMGNGKDWGWKGRSLGYVVSNTPTVGTAVSFPAGAVGSDKTYGHVAFVEYVNPDGSIFISESNAINDTTISYRVIDAQSAKTLEYIQGK